MFVGHWTQDYKICFDSSQETWKCAAGRLHGPHVGSVTNHQRVCLGTGHDKVTSSKFRDITHSIVACSEWHCPIAAIIRVCVGFSFVY